MIIRTTQDLALVNCRECELPVHPFPRIQRAFKRKGLGAEGFTLDGQRFAEDYDLPMPAAALVYRSVRRTITDTHPDVEDVTYTGSYAADGTLTESDPANRHAGSGLPISGGDGGTYTGGADYEDWDEDGEWKTFTWSYTLELSDPVTWDDLDAAARSVLDALPWVQPAGLVVSAATSYESAGATVGGVFVKTGEPGSVDFIALRFRFAPPENFSTPAARRSYYELQWDEVFFPAGVTGPGTLIASRSWIWNGNMADPWSPWYELQPPESPGVVRVVNIMALSWRSARIGQVPTDCGEIQ